LLTILILGLLIVGSLWTLLPFVGALVWATTIVIASWPALMLVESAVNGRRALAVVIMTTLVLLAFVTPLVLAIGTLVDAADRSPAVMSDFLARGLDPPPEWVAKVPLVGERISTEWLALSAGGRDALHAAVKPYAFAAASWILAATGGIGMMVVHVLLTVILVAILYAQGEVAARGVLAFVASVGGRRGEEVTKLAAKAVRSVALGVVLTALVQSVLAGIALWICGVPHPGILTAIAFVLGIAQLGPLLVLLPATIWLYWSGATGWAIALLVASLPIIALDNVLRPILIRRGVQLPMLLIIAGVIGGLIGFGAVGLFIGPVVLAASYTLLKAWIAEDVTATESPPVLETQTSAPPLPSVDTIAAHRS
jgi:predicted PurR-regulated permease PerM